jgi:hypothetical protein
LTSTLVIGSTRPVATTDRRIVPRSTMAICAGSMVVEAPVSAETPHTTPATLRTKVTRRVVLREVFIDTLVLTDRTGKGFQREICGFCGR